MNRNSRKLVAIILIFGGLILIALSRWKTGIILLISAFIFLPDD